VMEFYGHEKTLNLIKEVHQKHPIEADFKIFEDWDDFLILSREIKSDDNLIVVLSRDKSLSYHSKMEKIPSYLKKYFHPNSFILIYPMQAGVIDFDNENYINPSLLEPIEKLDEIGKTVARLFRKK
jgi:hypothetical protein